MPLGEYDELDRLIDNEIAEQKKRLFATLKGYARARLGGREPRQVPFRSPPILFLPMSKLAMEAYEMALRS